MYYGKKLPKLSGGLFLNEIKDKMINVTLKSLKERTEKMKIYSVHDTNLAGLMAAIGIYNDRQPPYASCLLIELWKIFDSNEDPLRNVAVKIFYNNKTQQSPKFPLEIVFRKCKSHPCTLKEFIIAIQPRTLTLSQYHRSCFQTNYSLWVLVILFSFIVLLVYLFLLISHFTQKYKSFQ